LQVNLATLRKQETAETDNYATGKPGVSAVGEELENSGDYEGARAALSGLWTRIGERPVIEKLQSDTEG